MIKRVVPMYTDETIANEIPKRQKVKNTLSVKDLILAKSRQRSSPEPSSSEEVDLF